MRLNILLKFFIVVVFFSFIFLSYFLSHPHYNLTDCLFISGQFFLVFFLLWQLLVKFLPQKIVAYLLSFVFIIDFLLVIYFLIVGIRFNWFYFCK